MKLHFLFPLLWWEIISRVLRLTKKGGEEAQRLLGATQWEQRVGSEIVKEGWCGSGKGKAWFEQYAIHVIQEWSDKRESEDKSGGAKKEMSSGGWTGPKHGELAGAAAYLDKCVFTGCCWSEAQASPDDAHRVIRRFWALPSSRTTCTQCRKPGYPTTLGTTYPPIAVWCTCLSAHAKWFWIR